MMTRFFLNGGEVDAPMGWSDSSFKKERHAIYGGFLGGGRTINNGLSGLIFDDSSVFSLVKDAFDGDCSGFEAVSFEVQQCNLPVFVGMIDWQETTITSDCKVSLSAKSTVASDSLINWAKTVYEIELPERVERTYSRAVERATHDLRGTFSKFCKEQETVYLPFESVKANKIEGVQDSDDLGTVFVNNGNGRKVRVRGFLKYRSNFDADFFVNNQKVDLVSGVNQVSYSFDFDLTGTEKIRQFMVCNGSGNADFVGSSYVSIDVEPKEDIEAVHYGITIEDLMFELLSRQNIFGFDVSVLSGLKGYLTSYEGLVGDEKATISMSLEELFISLRKLGYWLDIVNDTIVVSKAGDVSAQLPYFIEKPEFWKIGLSNNAKIANIEAGYGEWQVNGLYGLDERYSKVKYSTNQDGSSFDAVLPWVASHSLIADTIADKKSNDYIYWVDGMTPDEIVISLVDVFGGTFFRVSGVGGWRKNKDEVFSVGVLGCLSAFVTLRADVSVYDEIGSVIVMDGKRYLVLSVEALPDEDKTKDELDIEAIRIR